MADGGPFRNRSGEQFSTNSGNPQMPYFNTNPQQGNANGWGNIANNWQGGPQPAGGDTSNQWNPRPMPPQYKPVMADPVQRPFGTTQNPGQSGNWVMPDDSIMAAQSGYNNNVQNNMQNIQRSVWDNPMAQQGKQPVMPQYTTMPQPASNGFMQGYTPQTPAQWNWSRM